MVCVRSAGISASLAVGVQLETLEAPEGEDRDKRGAVAEVGDLQMSKASASGLDPEGEADNA
ncbi:hypothetical protein DJ71_21875 [Halorubrum sp. E3]|nr:hypothetical protein DJ71_21875 [Halorubrum sp. E3]